MSTTRVHNVYPQHRRASSVSGCSLDTKLPSSRLHDFHHQPIRQAQAQAPDSEQNDETVLPIDPRLTFTTSENHARDVKPIIDGWREKYEKDYQNLEKDFIDDCAGSRALDLADPLSTVLIWIEEGIPQSPARETIGFIGGIISTGKRRSCQIQRIYVIPPSRRSNIGRALVNCLANHISGRDVQRISLGSGLRHQKQSHRFWLSLGFLPEIRDKEIRDTVVTVADVQLLLKDVPDAHFRKPVS